MPLDFQHDGQELDRLHMLFKIRPVTRIEVIWKAIIVKVKPLTDDRESILYI